MVGVLMISEGLGDRRSGVRGQGSGVRGQGRVTCHLSIFFNTPFGDEDNDYIVIFKMIVIISINE